METINRLALTFLVNALWQIPLVAIAVAAAGRLMSGSPARYRHAVCVAGLIAAVALPLSSLRWPAPGRAVTLVPHTIAAQPQAATVSTSSAESPAPRSVPVPRTAASIGLCVLALFILYRLACLCRAAVETVRLCRTAALNTRACAVWERCREAFGISSAELRWSAAVTGPVTAGRTILLPESMADAPEEILWTAIGHESAHIARHDFAANLACELVALPVSFHPATAWLRREIARTRELACDELVTERLVEPDAYARAIVSIAAASSGFARPEYTLGVLDGDILEERVRRLMARGAADLKRAVDAGRGGRDPGRVHRDRLRSCHLRAGADARPTGDARRRGRVQRR
jgi:beta-lactamase regulating signal transducer with metallopeptidase domain